VPIQQLKQNERAGTARHIYKLQHIFHTVSQKKLRHQVFVTTLSNIERLPKLFQLLHFAGNLQ